MEDERECDPRAVELQRVGDIIDHLEVLYRQTRNPIYVWQALSEQSFLWKYPQRFGGEPYPLRIPDWMAEYLISVAGGVTALNAGLAVIKRNATAGQPCFGVVMVDEKRLSDKVASIMRLATNGTNAFRRYKSTLDDLRAARRVRELRDAGLTRDAALSAYISESREIDRSALEKRVSRGDRLARQLETIKAAKTAGL